MASEDLVYKTKVVQLYNYSFHIKFVSLVNEDE